MSPKTRGIQSVVCTSPLLDFHRLNMILIFLLKHDNSDSNIFLFQDPNRHLSSMALILWTTKDHALILTFSLRVNMLFYVTGSSYPITESSQNINFTTSTWFSFRDWIEIQEKS
jgi:hypothetical protein